jgi:hypothetical protein
VVVEVKDAGLGYFGLGRLNSPEYGRVALDRSRNDRAITPTALNSKAHDDVAVVTPA